MIYRRFKAIVFVTIPLFLVFAFTIIQLLFSGILIDYSVLGLFYIFAIILIISLSIIIIKMLRAKYGKNGELEAWHDKTLELMGDHWKCDVFDLMSFWKNDLKIINTSANKGIYDWILANKFIEKRLKVEYFLFDRESIREHVENFKRSGVFLKYITEKDAFEIKKNLAAEGLSHVNVIWDIKGCLWYSNKRMLEAFKNYYDVLEKDGIVIIDAMKVSTTKAFFNKFVGDIKGKYPGFAEVSTWSKLRKYIFKHEKLKMEFEAMFSVEFYELDHEHNVRIACLEKKS